MLRLSLQRMHATHLQSKTRNLEAYAVQARIVHWAHSSGRNECTKYAVSVHYVERAQTAPALCASCTVRRAWRAHEGLGFIDDALEGIVEREGRVVQPLVKGTHLPTRKRSGLVRAAG